MCSELGNLAVGEGMLQLVADGPEIPLEVLAALERGKLVLFCGAGVSATSGLPMFKGLVEQAYAVLGAQRTRAETQAAKKEQYDKTLGCSRTGWCPAPCASPSSRS